MGGGPASNAVVVSWAESLLDAARARAAPLFALGGIGVYLKCPGFRRYLDHSREPLSDVDHFTLRPAVRAVVGVFEALGLEENLEWRTLFGYQRRVFYTPENLTVELFIDRLYLCQEIDLRGYAGGAGPTLLPTDLFLSRIQKIGLEPKDFADLSVLLAAHEVGGAGADTLDLARLARLAGRNWPWWRTLHHNLAQLSGNRPSPFRDDVDVQRRLDALRGAVESSPRTLSWTLRALLGESLPWYHAVR